MLITNRHLTPIIGLDIHVVLILGAPVPMPHPYIGIVIDPMDYVPFIGSTINVNHLPRGKTDTSGMLVFLFHIPMGGPFVMAPTIGHDSVNFFGSKRVMAESTMLSPSGYMKMTCNDFGLPLSLKHAGKLKIIPTRYLPIAMSLPLSIGQSVRVGGPYVPDLMGALLNMVMTLGFSAVMRKAGQWIKKGLTALNKGVLKKLPGTKKLSDFLCKLGMEPVDLVQGIVIYDGIDFELPGPIPIKWQRAWYSDSTYKGPLGHGVHLNYDTYLQVFPEDQATALHLPDGRNTAFEQLHFPGQQDYNRHEKLTLTRLEGNQYQLFNHSEQQYYHFAKLHPSDKKHRLQSISNDAGFTIQLYYNNQDLLSTIIDAAGRHIHIQHDSEDRITNVSATHRGEKQQLVSYLYNETGDMSGITDALEQTTTIHYRNHLMVAKTDRNGQTFYWEYDGTSTGARCIHSWGDSGILEGFVEYHPEKGYNLFTNSLGQTTTYYYRPDFVITQVKDPMGGSVFYTYTEDMELYREVDQEGNLTGYTYDEQGNRTSIVQPDGSTYRFGYDERGRVTLAADPDGNSRIYTYYEDNGLLHTLTDADNTYSIFNYDEKNLLREVKDANRQRTLITYDEDFNVATIKSPDGSQSAWQYDTWGQCVYSKNPLEQEQRFRYDALGRVTDVKLPDGNQLKLRYNAYDEVVQATDKQHNVRFAYTPLGSLKIREENGARIHFAYDTEEQLHTVVNEHGESYRFIRDGRGHIIRETGFDDQTRHYDRDQTGRILKVNRPGGRYTDYEYDANGQLIRAVYSDGTWETYNYNRSGQLLEAANEQTTVRFQRDKAGRVIKEWQNGHEVINTFDRNGRRASIQSSLGADLQFARNHVGDITTIQATATGHDSPWLAQIQRNLLGLEIERTLPGGVKSSWSYDKAGLPLSHTVQSGHRTTRNRSYRWDVNQRLRQVIDGLSNGTTKFGHDDFGNLAWAQYENGQYDYRLPDKTGNLYRSQDRTDRQYGPGGKLLQSENTRFEYDLEGNLTRKIISAAPAGIALWQYQWYGNGMLKSVTRPDQQIVHFEYDALGRRTAKIFRGEITRWLWDNNTPLHEWKYPEKDRPQTTINDLGDIITTPEPIPVETLTTWVFEENTFTLAAKIEAGKQYSIINDHLGTPTEAYDLDGNRVWSAELDIYGNVRKLQGDNSFIPFRYQGQYWDVETGLCYNRFRYYNPETGTYICTDPAGLLGGLELYNYVYDPNIWIDFFGLNGVIWNNGWRTTNGKFGSPQGPGKSGQGAVDAVRTDLSGKGWTHLGDELSVRNSTGQLRRYDLVFKKPDGTTVGVEVKSNAASKTKAQRVFDNGVSKVTPAKGVGKFKGQEIEEVLTIKKVKCS